MEDTKTYKNFKTLLEYFISHLEWVENEDTGHIGYNKYIKPLTNFIKTGLGYKGQGIQNQIKDWAEYDDTVCINVNCNYGSYKTALCYLNWVDTYINVRPKWNNENHIDKLYLSKEETPSAKSELTMTLEELGLFDNTDPNNKLKKFFDKYKQLGIQYYQQERMKSYIKLLTSNHNLILTGAPGTGKTYLAQLIAKELGATRENGRCKMVQFHPSYDYTDFVEGLRPINTGINSIGFELRYGTFKKFCAEALSNYISSKNAGQISVNKVFKLAYQDFINDIKQGGSHSAASQIKS